jgi:pimeloyl-ACP methyl ester carboxylesterase
MGVPESWTSLPLQRVNVNGADLEYRTVGSGEPVVLIHGAHIADAVMPLLSEPALTVRFQLIAYHRRGFAGSSRIDRPLTVSEQANDCHGLLQALGIKRAHIMGFSYGGDIALQLALDASDVVQTIAVLEPPLVFLPSAAQQVPSLMAAMGRYQSGDKAGAFDTFM